jgi:hypothetical protein
MIVQVLSQGRFNWKWLRKKFQNIIFLGSMAHNNQFSYALFAIVSNSLFGDCKALHLKQVDDRLLLVTLFG